MKYKEQRNILSNGGNVMSNIEETAVCLRNTINKKKMLNIRLTIKETILIHEIESALYDFSKI
ncbi:hypothetical protein [Staphylococcus haemolyticus]|uniref:hypothetical protein n=1 Tax=Staphylococcus haemolyticus TaxID=1283 RepID=UPI0015D6F0D7|nr:hypothetical protein [Staphylococcus haemolyticus]